MIRPEHLKELAASGISEALAETAGIYSADERGVYEILGWLPKALNTWGAGLVFPFPDHTGRLGGFARVKCDYPRSDPRGKPSKYETAPKRANRAYCPPTVAERMKREPRARDLISEGEKTAL